MTERGSFVLPVLFVYDYITWESGRADCLVAAHTYPFLVEYYGSTLPIASTYTPAFNSTSLTS